MRKYLTKKNILIGALILIAIILGAVLSAKSSKDEDVVYKETKAEYGELTVGISTNGSISIGTNTQTFELDLSEYSGITSTSTGTQNGMSGGMPSGGMGGGMPSGSSGGGSSMFGFMSGSAGSTSDSGNSLEVGEVKVCVGQEIKKGDILYTLTDDSVDDIREQMESDVKSAKADLDTIISDNKVSSVSALDTKNVTEKYGSYALAEYNQSIYDAELNIQELTETVELYEKQIQENKEKLAQDQEDLVALKEIEDNFAWSVNHMDANDETSLYLEYENSRETAHKNVESMESTIEQLEEKIETSEKELKSLNLKLREAQRSLETTKLTAKEQYDLRILYSENAEETYDVTIGYLNLKERKQTKIYEDAKEKLEEFDTTISNGSIIAAEDGIVTEVPLASGDTITTGTKLLTVYDAAETSIQVSVSDTEVKELEEGGAVNITIDAYPDQLFKGQIESIDDAETDSDGETTYPVTVKILGETSGLYESMTADLCFITKETEKVLYVSNRAVYRKGTKSFVKVKDESGKVEEKEITTGFSDGENVEVIAGLSEGDTVLIESKVTGK